LSIKQLIEFGSPYERLEKDRQFSKKLLENLLGNRQRTRFKYQFCTSIISARIADLGVFFAFRAIIFLKLRDIVYWTIASRTWFLSWRRPLSLLKNGCYIRLLHVFSSASPLKHLCHLLHLRLNIAHVSYL
jgi:hypothetical protein